MADIIIQYLPLVGAVMTIATAVHGLFLALSAKWPNTTAFGKLALWTGVIAVDIGKILSLFGVGQQTSAAKRITFPPKGDAA